MLHLMLSQAEAGTQATLYVSPNGSGTSFSLAQPGSLVGAQTFIRTINLNMTGDIVVYLLDGTYQLTNSFTLQENTTTHDSGTSGYNIIYTAYPGAVPILSGGITVTNWSLYNSANNIWTSYVGTGVNSRQLYVNSLCAIRARGALNPSGFTVSTNGVTAPNRLYGKLGKHNRH